MNNFKGQPKIVDIDKIKPNYWNPKDSIEENRFNKDKFEEIKDNLEKKKQYLPILVRQLKDEEKSENLDVEYQIIDGYHRWLAAKELGWSSILVWDLGQISEEEAKGITLDSIYLQIPASEVLVAKVVSEVVKLNPDNLKYLPYPKDKVEEYLKMAEFDWEELKTEEISNTNNDHKIKCPNCGFEFLESEGL